MSDVGFVLEVDTAPLMAMAHRADRALEDIGREVGALLQAGAAGQFSAGATWDGARVTSWPAPRGFDGGSPMVKSGKLAAAWSGGAGGFVDVRPRSGFAGVKSPAYVASFHRREPATLAGGFALIPRPIGVSDATAAEVARMAEREIAGEDGEVVA